MKKAIYAVEVRKYRNLSIEWTLASRTLSMTYLTKRASNDVMKIFQVLQPYNPWTSNSITPLPSPGRVLCTVPVTNQRVGPPSLIKFHSIDKKFHIPFPLSYIFTFGKTTHIQRRCLNMCINMCVVNLRATIFRLCT